MKDIRFDNKFAVVTGGSRGIGKAIAELLLQLGCEVLITSTGKKPVWCQHFKKIHHYSVDFCNSIAMQNFLEKIQNIGKIDILINNAAANFSEHIYGMVMKNWDQLLKVNLTAPLQIMNVIAKKMMNVNSGKIVNMSSITSIQTRQTSASYATTKSGLVGLTKAASLDLAPYNILVNAICPGYTETEMTNTILTKQQKKDLVTHVALKRLAQTEEIARFVIFLCSDWNTYITGQTIVVDGGVTIQ